MKREALTTVLIFIWALMFTHLVRAATIAEFIGPYDPSLIYWAAGFSVLGGLLRTILSLQGDERVIVQKVKEWLWNIVNGFIAGMVAFFAVQALRSMGYAVPIELRFGAVVAAGWGGIAAIHWMRDTFKAWVGAKLPSVYVDGYKPKDKP